MNSLRNSPMKTEKASPTSFLPAAPRVRCALALAAFAYRRMLSGRPLSAKSDAKLRTEATKEGKGWLYGRIPLNIQLHHAEE